MSKAFKRIPKFFFLILLGLVLFSSLYTIQSLAQTQFNGQSLEVSPPTQDVEGAPGKTITVKAKVRNRNNTANTIKVRLEDFTAQGDEGQVALTTESDYSVASWANISPETFILGPGEDKEITAEITIPAGVAGGRYGSFVFSIVPANAGKQTETALAQEVASLFLLKISGPVNEQLSVSYFKAPVFSEYGPITFDLAFKNQGNIHVKTFGLINVQNIFGHKIADVVVSGTNVFPGATRIIHPELSKKFLFGPHTATAIMYYGAGNQTITSTTSFTVFPLKLAVIVLLVIILLYVGRKRISRAMNALFK